MTYLILEPLGNSRAIKLTLKGKGKGDQYEETALSGEDLVLTLDKILKVANIESTSIDKVKISPGSQASLTSIRLAKTFKHALLIAKSVKPKVP